MEFTISIVSIIGAVVGILGSLISGLLYDKVKPTKETEERLVKKRIAEVKDAVASLKGRAVALRWLSGTTLFIQFVVAVGLLLSVVQESLASWALGLLAATALLAAVLQNFVQPEKQLLAIHHKLTSLQALRRQAEESVARLDIKSDGQNSQNRREDEVLLAQEISTALEAHKVY